MNILMVGFDSQRWGSARLLKALDAAGFDVAALCASDNPLAKTRYLRKHFPLRDVLSSRHFESRLAHAIEVWKPELIVPADERVVACLHALIRKALAGDATCLSEAALTIVIDSFGDPEQFDATLLKSSTLQLATKLGLRVPDGRTVSSVDAARSAAEQIGFPVYVKSSFSWAGQGVCFCRNASEVAAAVTRAAQPRSWMRLRTMIKRVMHRDWYPTETAIDVQRSIKGTPAMFCAVAIQGRMVAGFAGITQQTCAANGPSSIVWIGADAEMERMSEIMVRTLGATGFVAFDFMIDDATGDIYLLECNPRPIPVCHLGSRIGVDLCVALKAELAGESRTASEHIIGETITLFPQEWLRNPVGIARTGNYVDIPLDDPPLLRAMVDAFDGAALTPAPAEKPVASRSFKFRPSLAWR
jgi:carbamoyl-phosphate synthase large subunit